MTQQASLSDVTATGVERPAIESPTADEHRPDHDTVLLSVPNRRHLPDGHDWAGKRPEWCSDCRTVVRRVPV